MKKLENPNQELCRNYLRDKILPRLQEVQRDLFGNDSLSLNVDVGASGYFVTAFCAFMNDGDVQDSASLHLSVYDKYDWIEAECERLKDFIKKYTA